MSAAVARAKVVWTYDDLRLIPTDRNRYEVLDGELFVSPAPLTKHQRISKRIEFELIVQIEHLGLGEVFYAPTDVIFAKKAVAEPDLLVVKTSRKNIISERGIEGPPDLIVEILSPSTRDHDLIVKRKLYAQFGVPEYWIVDPEANTVDVLTLGPEGYIDHAHYAAGETVRAQTFDASIAIDKIFAS